MKRAVTLYFCSIGPGVETKLPTTSNPITATGKNPMMKMIMMMDQQQQQLYDRRKLQFVSCVSSRRRRRRRRIVVPHYNVATTTTTFVVLLVLVGWSSSLLLWWDVHHHHHVDAHEHTITTSSNYVDVDTTTTTTTKHEDDDRKKSMTKTTTTPRKSRWNGRQLQQQAVPDVTQQLSMTSKSNIVKELWQKFQQVTTSSSSSSSSSATSHPHNKLSVPSTKNQGADKELVLTSSQQEWIEQLWLQQQEQQQQEQSTISNAKQQQKQQQEQQQRRHGITIHGYQRRKALYKYTIQQHYATSYLRHVSLGVHNSTNSNDITTTTATKSISNDEIPQQQQQQQQQQKLFNETIWKMANQAFYAYTYTAGNNRPDDSETRTTTTTTTNNKNHSNVKIDRTSFLYDGLPPYPKSRQQQNQQLIQTMFNYGYDAYMYHAFPEYGEICPISCVPCTFDLVKLPALTLIDSLDTLLVFQNRTEFARSVERLRLLHTMSSSSSMFAINQNVSVFETNIRVLGGLLSAHQLALAMKLDQKNYNRPDEDTHNNSDPSTILLLDIFDAVVMTKDDTENVPPVVRYGTIDLTIDPIERWLRYTDHQQGYTEKEESISDNVEQSLYDVCPASFDASTAAITSSHLASMSPCDSSGVSSSLPQILQKSPFMTPYSSTCCTTINTTTTATKTMEHRILSSNNQVPKIPDSDIWTYDGFLLELAFDIGNRLLPAFSTPTGIPYGTVNLLYGVPSDETTVASLAGGGTVSIEFELLSRLTGDTRFGKAARMASRALFRYRSKLNLFGKHIDIRSGAWVETLSGIGSNSDSYLEYLAKHYMLFPEDDDFWIMFKVAYAGVHNESRLGEWYADVDMNYGSSSGQSRHVFESLAAFYPGLQVLLGEIAPAARSLNSMFMVREILGFLPERFNYGVWNLDHHRDGAGIHPLRPELLESNYLMHRATRGLRTGQSSHRKDDNTSDIRASGWQWAADYALHKLAIVTKAQCGFAGINEVKPQTTGSVENSNAGITYIDEMPSFFLSETLKYLYLTFDDDNILHQDGDHQWIFTTEAHPVHYVPQKSSSTSTVSSHRESIRDVEAVKAILRRRLHNIDDNKPNTTHLKYDISFFRGRWTKVVNNVSYRDDIDNVIQQKILYRPNAESNAYTDHISQFVPSCQFEQDAFRENGNKSNIANLALGNLGSGLQIQKNCLNIDSSDKLWMHALSGGATDYSNTYVTTGHDALIEEPHYFTIFGAADAIGSQGIGVYAGEHDMEGDRCPISTTNVDDSVTVLVDETGGGNTSTIMESDVGNFEISTYPSGTGFQVRHIENGEMIKATVVGSDNPPGHSVAIVHSELCTKKWILLTKASVDNDGGFEVAREKRRRSSIADFEGNSFSCEIKLIKVDTDTEGSEDNKETILTAIPCTPAAFGATQMSQLKEHGSITVDARLYGPSDEDMLGCNVPSAPSQSLIEYGFAPSEKIEINIVGDEILDTDANAQRTWAANSIRTVLRGDCSFFSKAVNMFKAWNADALIVINSSDEMFMMSSSPEDTVNVDPIEIPISVLISEQDGAVLLESINDDIVNQSPSFFARIEVVQSLSIDDHGEIEATQIDWPIVRGKHNVLEIMAEFGWGVQAVHKTEGQYQEWQLSILKHSMDKQG